MEWDTGAAHVIANESGAKLSGFIDGAYVSFLYNKINLLNSKFIVAWINCYKEIINLWKLKSVVEK